MGCGRVVSFDELWACRKKGANEGQKKAEGSWVSVFKTNLVLGRCACRCKWGLTWVQSSREGVADASLPPYFATWLMCLSIFPMRNSQSPRDLGEFPSEPLQDSSSYSILFVVSFAACSVRLQLSACTARLNTHLCNRLGMPAIPYHCSANQCPSVGTCSLQNLHMLVKSLLWA